MLKNLFEELNPEQKRAVETTEGPLLILAGAGSGKTKTLTHRIAYLLGENKAEPHNILAVTFTNKAANEMRQRIWSLLYRELAHASAEIPRSFMPFIGTFHGICVRLLRQDGEHIGISPSFVIFDESDRQTAIKQVSKQLMLDEKSFPARSISNLISSAKNELMTPDVFAGTGSGPMHDAAAKVYPLYQRLLKEAQALDFDDLIMRTVRLLESHDEIRHKWQEQFRYVMIDEYQDTNAAQYQLVQLLIGSQQNIAVVGDDWQCILPGSLVDTRAGSQPIEKLKKGDYVRAASGYTKSGFFPVQRTRTFEYKGNLVEVTTASGKKITTTPHHMFFSRWDSTDKYFVYLMHEKQKGFRIGLAKGTRFDGKKNDIGLRVRANQERADAMWILKICSSRAEATYHEAHFAFSYGIPTIVFRADANRSMSITQEQINTLYADIDTKERAKKLLSDTELLFDYPHFRPNAITAQNHSRITINVVLFGDSRTTMRSPWSASRISANTTRKQDLAVFEELGYSVRPGRSSTYRSEVHNLDYGAIEKIVETVQQKKPESEIYRYAFVGKNKQHFTPATHLHPGMLLPVMADDKIVEEKITSVKRISYDGKVYDIDVENVHNYSANGIVSHNSIYSWRGADFKNILNFERDYPDATIIKLEQNYRSTKAILDAAHTIISKNKQRSDKKLWTKASSGNPVKIIQAVNERAEAEAIITRISNATEVKIRQYKDFAVLYRTNAQSRALEELFMRYGIPYRIVGGVRFYDRKEIKDVIAYLRLIFQPEDRVSFERIVNTPTRGIGAKSVQQFFDLVREEGGIEAAFRAVEDSGITPRAKSSLSELHQILEITRAQSSDTSVSFLLESLLRKIRYMEHLDDGSIQGESRQENIKELIGVAKAYDELGLATFLEEVSLISDLDGADFSGNAVTLMTLHAAKGLEFPVVFMAGMEESIFPHSRSLFDQHEMEEERRLCYVGMTRAKEELYLLHATSRMLFGSMQYNLPSRFLSDIDDTQLEATTPFTMPDVTTAPAPPTKDEPTYVPDLSEGDGVSHPVFGDGTVVELDGDIATIYFKQKGPKKINISFAPIKKLSDES